MMDLLFRGRTLVFESPLSLEEVASRLQREVAPPTWRRRETRPQLFEGTFAGGRFRMVRLVRGRNSFRPVIEGRISPRPGGVRVDAQLKLHPIAVALCAVLFCFIGLFAVIAVVEFLSTRQASPPLFVVLGMAVVFFALLTVAPGIEARKSTRLLADLLESQPTAPSATPGAGHSA